MSIIFDAATSNSTSSDNKPKAQVYLNVGKTMTIQNTDGTTEERFISIPIGIAIDTMEPTAARGSDPVWLAQVGVKNAFLKQLQDMGENMQQGDAQLVEGLELQLLRRAAPAAAPRAADNPLMEQVSQSPIRLVGKKDEPVVNDVTAGIKISA